jgi:hypothetical protein
MDTAEDAIRILNATTESLWKERDDLKQQLAEANTIIAVYRRTTESIVAARERERVLREALKTVDSVLTVPAAEYVPAIRDAWDVIESTLKQLDSTEGEGKDE